MENENSKKGLKMGELARQTGFSREMIHYYLREGLLPPPSKTHPNVAFYDSSHVERLRLIRRLKEERRLTVAEIKEYLTGKGKPYLDEEIITGALTHEPLRGRRLSKNALLKESGLTASNHRLLIQNGLCSPQKTEGKETYGITDLEVARSFRRILDTGCPAPLAIELVGPYVESFREPVGNEILALFNVPIEETEDIAEAYSALETAIERFLLDARREILGDSVREIMWELRRRATEISESYKDRTGVVTYLSSGYYNRFKPSFIIRALKDQIDKNPSDLESYFTLFGIYLAKGDINQLLSWSKKALEVAPADPRVLYYLGVAHARNFRIDEALSVLSRCVELDEHFAMARGWLGATMLLGAVQKTELAEVIAMIRGGIEQLDRSKKDEPEDVAQLLNLKGTRGKALSMLPRFLGRHDEGMQELKDTVELAKLEKGKSEDPFYLGYLDLILLNVYLTLGEEYGEDGMIEERNRAWGEFLKIDPKNKLSAILRAKIS